MNPSALRRLRPRTVALAALALVALAVPAFASDAVFVAVGNPKFPGTAITKTFEGQIEASGFSLGFSSPVDASSGQFLAQRMNPIVITKIVDASTPLLAQASINRTPLQNFKISALVVPLRPPTSGAVETFIITVPSGYITDWRVVDTKDGSTTEQLTILTTSYSLEHRDFLGKTLSTSTIGINK